MDENRKQILEMLAAGKINADEAERLLTALEGSASGVETAAGGKSKYLRVVVESDDGQGLHGPSKVNVRVPMQLLRAGVKLANFIPSQARNQVNSALRDKGVMFDVGELKPENLEELIDHLNDLTIDVNDDHNRVRIFCE